MLMLSEVVRGGTGPRSARDDDNVAPNRSFRVLTSNDNKLGCCLNVGALSPDFKSSYA